MFPAPEYGGRSAAHRKSVARTALSLLASRSLFQISPSLQHDPDQTYICPIPYTVTRSARFLPDASPTQPPPRKARRRTFSKASATIMATVGWKWMSATRGTSYLRVCVWVRIEYVC